MKLIAIVIVLAVAGFVVKSRLDKVNPTVIEHPVYAEMRVDSKMGNREFNIALFAKAVDLDDCNLRSGKTWGKVLAGCPTCEISPVKCLDALPPRYARLFDNVAIPSTYLAFTRGSRFERDGRLVVYGLTRAEGLTVCEYLRSSVSKQDYAGTLECIAPSE
jgi:hypothetical protein